jgi:four helix bundle protein
MKENILKIKSMNFAIRIVNVYKHLCQEKNEYVMSKQLLRSGTAIGALQREAEHAESKPDFIHKYAIAQKECNETIYWLELLYKTNFLTESEYNSIANDAAELIKIITSSLKTVKNSL